MPLHTPSAYFIIIDDSLIICSGVHKLADQFDQKVDWGSYTPY